MRWNSPYQDRCIWSWFSERVYRRPVIHRYSTWGRLAVGCTGTVWTEASEGWRARSVESAVWRVVPDSDPHRVVDGDAGLTSRCCHTSWTGTPAEYEARVGVPPDWVSTLAPPSHWAGCWAHSWPPASADTWPARTLDSLRVRRCSSWPAAGSALRWPDNSRPDAVDTVTRPHLAVPASRRLDVDTSNTAPSQHICTRSKQSLQTCTHSIACLSEKRYITGGQQSRPFSPS